MRAFILAGGQGSRTANPILPKILTSVAGATLLELQLSELTSVEEVTQITLLLGHGAGEVIKQLETFLSQHLTDKVIDYVIEEQPMGSAGMLRQVISGSNDDVCFVTLGDILPRGGIMECFHLWKTTESRDQSAIFVHPNNHPSDSDSVQREAGAWTVEGIISSKEEASPFRENLSPVGFFFLKIRDLSFWPSARKIDLVQDVLSSLLSAKVPLWAPDLLRRSLDIGTPKRLTRLQEVLQTVEMILDWVVFIDRDDTLVKDPTTVLNRGKDLELMDGIVPLLRFLNDTGVPVVCISNQPSIAKGQSTFLKIDDQNRVIQDLLSGEGVYIDKWLYCPHHPETGFEGEIKELKISCNCRKPKAGMIQEVARQHNIDVSGSVIIGDTFRDVEIQANLALRIHFLPTETCDILTNHLCVQSFEDAQNEIAALLGGSRDNDHR